MKAVYCIAAEGVVTDAATNIVSLHSLCEEFVTNMFPTNMPKVALCVTVEKEKGDKALHQGVLKVYNNSTSLGEFPIQIDFQDKDRARTIVYIQGLVVPEPGRVKFSVRMKEKEICKWEVLAHRGDPLALAPPQVLPLR